MVERILPREFPTPPNFYIPLSNAELQELGTFSAIWGQLDFLLFTLISTLTKLEMASLQLMLENMTTGPRVGLLTKLCQRNPNPTTAAIKKLCDDNGGLINDRNHVLHGIWAIEWIYETNKTNAACMYQKGGAKPIQAGKLAVLSNRAAAFSNALADLLGDLDARFKRSETPGPFFFGAGSPVSAGPPPPWPPA
jgi:hypothetical protein